MGSTTTTTEERPTSFAARHRASGIVLASQLSAALVHGVVKALESSSTGAAVADEPAVAPMQILLVRMLITGVGCSLYLWATCNPEFPLGQRDARPLLLLRAVGGILGAGGMYYSISYLTLSQATALNFLAPMGAMILSKYLDHGTFSVTDRACAAIALAGVVMVVQPDGIFKRNETLPLGPQHDSYAKIKGLSCGAVGILGTIIALTTMRRIGSKAHPLTVVNWFAWVIVIVTATVLVIERPVWPHSLKSWCFLAIVGFFGGLMEFLLTAGISGDRTSAATVMIYSQVLWALAIDRVVWHVGLNIWTFVGIGGVVGSLVLVSLAKEMPVLRRKDAQTYEAVLTSEPENGMSSHDIDLDDMFDEEEGDDAV